MGKAASHTVRTTLFLTPLPGKVSILKPLIAYIRAATTHAVQADAAAVNKRRGRRLKIQNQRPARSSQDHPLIPASSITLEYWANCSLMCAVNCAGSIK